MRRPSAAVVNEEDCIFVKDDICIRKFDKTGWPLQDIGFKQFSRPFGKYIGLDKQKIFERKIVNIFLPISFNIRFGCSKEPSH